MISKNKGTALRKACRGIHRDLSFFFAGMIIIYSLSGLFMNHRHSINPSYTVSRHEYKINTPLPGKEKMNKEKVLELLRPLNEEKNFTQFYFPQPQQMKVFLKGGSSLTVNTSTGETVYESVKSRPLIAPMVKLHFNPGSWWTWFADIFAVSLILITLTGLWMVKGNKGLWGRGGIELIAGILIPAIPACLTF